MDTAGDTATPTAPAQAYAALRDGAVFITRERRGIVAVTGKDAAAYLQGQLTNDTEAVGPGHGVYAALLDRKGRMQSDMRVLRLADDDFTIETEPEPLPVVERHLQMYKIGREVAVTGRSAAWSLVTVLGPASHTVTGAGPMASEHDHHKIVVAGVECLGIRTLDGIDLLVPDDGSAPAAVAAALAGAGAVHAGPGLLDIARVEAGRPRFGSEMTTATIPQEAGINERAVSFTKGCYIGQETVARLHYKGRPNRRLRGLRSAVPLAAGAGVSLDGRKLGLVGTAVDSPAHGPLALAILRREAEPDGTVTVTIGPEGPETVATVVELPFPAAATS